MKNLTKKEKRNLVTKGWCLFWTILALLGFIMVITVENVRSFSVMVTIATVGFCIMMISIRMRYEASEYKNDHPELF